LAVLGVLLTWSVHRRSAREKGSAKQAAASPKEIMEEAANPMAQDDTVVGADAKEEFGMGYGVSEFFGFST
jgi:hypothetical protein